MSYNILKVASAFTAIAALSLPIALHAGDKSQDRATKLQEIPPPTIDTDGDGKPDAWDRDGDGAPDAWDTNGDGRPDQLDNDGDGKPDTKLPEPTPTPPESKK